MTLFKHAAINPPLENPSNQISTWTEFIHLHVLSSFPTNSFQSIPPTNLISIETTPQVAPQIATGKDTPNSMDVGEQRNLLSRYR